jgi:hypothetical protein
MLRRVVLVITDVSEERIVSIIRLNRISELGITLAESSNWITMFAGSFQPIHEGYAFLRNNGSYKSHTASHPRKGILLSRFRENLNLMRQNI